MPKNRLLKNFLVYLQKIKQMGIFTKKRDIKEVNVWKPSSFERLIGKYNLNFSESFITDIFIKITDVLSTIDYQQENVLNNREDFVKMRLFLKDNYLTILLRLFYDGFLYIGKNSNGYFIDEETKKGLLIQSDVFRVRGKSQQELSLSWIKYFDNILNSAYTGNARLGNVTIIKPTSTDMGSEVIDEQTRKRIERDASRSYGSLSEQSNVWIMPQDVGIDNISFDITKLALLDQMQLVAKILTDKIGIPYELMAISGQSTYSNREQAMIDFYNLIDKWAIFFIDIFDRAGIKIDSYNVPNKPNYEQNLKEEQKLKKIQMLNLALSSGILSSQEARAELRTLFEIE